MAEEPNKPPEKTEEQQPESKRAPRDKSESDSPEAIEEDIAVDDRFQSTDN